MIIDKQLLEIGVDEGLIRLLHHRTKLAHRNIESAELIKSVDNKFLVKLILEKTDKYRSGRHTVLNIDKDRIREIKLKILFN